MHRAYIVEYYHQRQFLSLTEFFYRQALHLYRAKFFHT